MCLTCAVRAVWFTLEYLVRLACAPNRLRFLGAFMNLIDVAAILPYYLNLCVDALQPITGVGMQKVRACDCASRRCALLVERIETMRMPEG